MKFNVQNALVAGFIMILISFSSSSLAEDNFDVTLAPIIAGQWESKGTYLNKWANNILLKNHKINIDVAKVRFKNIPFYSNANRKVKLVEISETHQKGAYYLVAIFSKSSKNGYSILLSGYSDPIHLLNKILNFSVDAPEDAVNYLKFFCSAITSNEGVYWIVDPDGNELNISFLNMVAKSINTEAIDNNDWKITSSLIYGNTLYDVGFVVHNDGKVEMTNDSTVQALPINLIVAFESGRRYLAH